MGSTLDKEFWESTIDHVAWLIEERREGPHDVLVDWLVGVREVPKKEQAEEIVALAKERVAMNCRPV